MNRLFTEAESADIVIERLAGCEDPRFREIMESAIRHLHALPMPPNNLSYTIVGAAMLWVGWFGFNAGSELAADGVAGMALAVTQLATAAAALAWMFCEWIRHGKPSVLGMLGARCTPRRNPPRWSRVSELRRAGRWHVDGDGRSRKMKRFAMRRR